MCEIEYYFDCLNSPTCIRLTENSVDYFYNYHQPECIGKYEEIDPYYIDPSSDVITILQPLPKYREKVKSVVTRLILKGVVGVNEYRVE